SGGTSRRDREEMYEPWNNRALIWKSSLFPNALQIIGEMLENREGLLDGRMRTVAVPENFRPRFPEDMIALPGPIPSPMERDSVAALHINDFFEKYIASVDVLLMVREHGRYHPATDDFRGYWAMDHVTMSLLCLPTHDFPHSIR
ncbi:unnamed protein product, partial [Mesorhabditis spiculigera]